MLGLCVFSFGREHVGQLPIVTAAHMDTLLSLQCCAKFEVTCCIYSVWGEQTREADPQIKRDRVTVYPRSPPKARARPL